VIVRVDTDGAALEEPLEFGSFHVELYDGADPLDRPELSEAVRFESDDEAWVSAEWLRAQPPFVGDASARERLDGMIAYAVDHGWFDDARNEIAAHVVRPAPE
jgi:hypothetical protein